MKNLEVEHIKCHATPGATLYKCADDAALIALGENRNVLFVHNNIEYEASPMNLRSIVISTGKRIVQK